MINGAVSHLHTGNQFQIIRITDYSYRSSGKLQVLADTLETLNDGIDWVLKRYPEQGYGTVVHQIERHPTYKTFSVIIEHWGAD